MWSHDIYGTVFGFRLWISTPASITVKDFRSILISGPQLLLFPLVEEFVFPSLDPRQILRGIESHSWQRRIESCAKSTRAEEIMGSLIVNKLFLLLELCIFLVEPRRKLHNGLLILRQSESPMEQVIWVGMVTVIHGKLLIRWDMLDGEDPKFLRLFTVLKLAVWSQRMVDHVDSWNQAEEYFIVGCANLLNSALNCLHGPSVFLKCKGEFWTQVCKDLMMSLQKCLLSLVFRLCTWSVEPF